MATNLEYIYRLKDQYSKKLRAITKAQLVFTQQYTKSMGKINATLIKNTSLLHTNTKAIQANAKYTATAVTQKVQSNHRHWSSVNSVTNAYSRNKQAITSLNSEMGKLTNKQRQYNRSSQVGMRAPIGRGLSGSRGITSDKLGALTAGTGGAFFLKGAITTTADFQRNLNGIRAVLPEVNRELMREKAIKWGNKTIFSAVQVAGAMREAAQAGMDQNAILKSMPGNLALAASGEMDLVSAMKLSTDVVNQFGKTVGNQRIADILAKGASQSTSKVRELGAALGNFGNVAHQAGMSAREAVGLAMGIGESGETLRGESGGTYLMNMVRGMQSMKGKGKLRKALRSFLKGTDTRIFDVFDIKTGQFRNIKLFMKLLAGAEKSKVVELATAFRIQGAKAINALAALDAGQLAKIWKTMRNVEGASQSMADILMEGLPGSLARLNSAWETSKIVMLESFIPALSYVMGLFTDLLVYLQDNHKWILQLGFAVIGATTILTGLGFAIWSVTGAYGAWKVATMALYGALKAHPILAVTSALISLVYYLGLSTESVDGLKGSFWSFDTFLRNSFMGTLKLVTKGALFLYGLMAEVTDLASFGGKNIVGDALRSTMRKQLEYIDKINAIANKEGQYSKALSITYDVMTGQDGATQPQGNKSQMDQVSKEATSGRTQQTNTSLNVGGNIKVAAEKGLEVIQSTFNYDLGANMGYYD
jgi:TP901 family phage tail tape measure protein